jgi:hypothetical protein
MQAFLDSQEQPKMTRFRLGQLPELPQDPAGGGEEGAENEASLPVRTTMTHGFYARSQPAEAVQAVLAENVQGIDEQIRCLRQLGRGLMERLAAAAGAEAARIGEAHGKNATRLAELLRIEEQLAEMPEEDLAEAQFLAAMREIALEVGGLAG